MPNAGLFSVRLRSKRHGLDRPPPGVGMAISQKTIKMLWGRAASLCSICRHHLVVDKTEDDNETLIGDMCHIVAEKEDGPRGHSPLTPEQRDEYGNLVLLCRNHHAEIDGQPETFSIERLKTVKADHERWVRDSLSDYDPRKQQDDETYAGYIDEWACRCNLDSWTGWSSFILGGDQPIITVELDRQLEELGPWLLGRVWPSRYPSIKEAFTNFRLILEDFRKTFLRHAEKPTPDNEWLYDQKILSN